MGLLLRMGFLKPLKNRLFTDQASVLRAEQSVQRWSKYIGEPAL